MSRKFFAVYLLMSALALSASVSCEQKSAQPAGPTPPTTTQPAAKRLNPFPGGIEVTNMLPNPFDRNMVQSEFVYAGAKNDELLSGESDVRKPFDGRIDIKVRTDRLFQPAGAAILRAEFDPAKSMNLLGSTVSIDAPKQAIYLVDDEGRQYFPIGYVWAKNGNEHRIRVDHNKFITNAFEVPFPSVTTGEHIYLYWQAPSHTHIKRVVVGQKDWFEANVNVP